MVYRQNVFSLGVELGSLAAWGALAFFISSLLFRWEPEAKLPRNAKLWAVATILPFILLGIWENQNGKLLSTAASMMSEQPVEGARLRPRKLRDLRQIGPIFRRYTAKMAEKRMLTMRSFRLTLLPG